MADKDFVVLDYLGKDRLKMINPDTAAQPTRRAIESVDGYWDWYNEMSEKHIQCPLAQACDLLDADQVHVSGHTLVAILGVEDYEESSKITDAAILFYIAWDSRNISRDDCAKLLQGDLIDTGINATWVCNSCIVCCLSSDNDR